MKSSLNKLLPVLFMLLSISAIGQTADDLIDRGYEKYEKGDYKKAILEFDKAAKLAPDNPEIFYLRGVCKSQAGLNKDAVKDYDIALKIDPTYTEVHYEKGYALFLDNKGIEAIKSFDQAIKLRPGYAEAWFNRGSVKCILGDKEGALADWKKAEELGAVVPDQNCD